MANTVRPFSGRTALFQFCDIAADGTEDGSYASFLPASNWRVTIGRGIEAVNTIDGDGWEQNVAMAASAKGSMEFVVSPDANISDTVVTGNLIYIKLLADTGGEFVKGKARVGTVDYSWDRAGGAQKATINFESYGPWSGVLMGSIANTNDPVLS